jgi:hypothetical protein
MFYAHLPTIRIARSAVLTAAAVGLILSYGTALSQSRSAVGAAPIAATAASVNARAVGQVTSPQPLLNPRHPDQYTVQPGDTLWDIAGLFLQDPWYWPEIWQINPQVANPHLIYPGDLLSLAYDADGQPYIQLERGGLVERLSPRVRSEPLENAIPTIPSEVIRAFLSRPAIVEEGQLAELPYIVAHREGLLGSAGQDVYVRGSTEPVGSVYDLIHLGDELIDPDTNETLGYEGLYVGQGRVSREGDPSTISLLDTAREARRGDYLLEIENIQPANYFPRAPGNSVDGRIISVIDGLSLVGQYQVVVLNRGAAHGLEQGHVLRAFQTGELIDDEVSERGLTGEKVQLPDEPAGTMMVFRIFDRMSYALVMEATSEIRVLDIARNP